MTPTNEAGHGLPELPEPDFVTPDDNLYTVHTMRRYARAALALSRGVPAEKMAPVQGYTPGIPWSMHLEAYDVYCKRYRPQPALIEGWCRGGFSTGELDMFIPGWRERLSEFNAMKARIAELESLIKAAPAAAGAQGEEYAACCDTPAYCSSVRRCTRMDTTPQPAAASKCSCPSGDGSLRWPCAVHQPAAADGGVRERAREILAGEVASDYPKMARALVAGKSMESYVLVPHCLRAIEAALSSHRQAGEPDAYIESYEVDGNLRQGLVWADHPANTHGSTFVPLYTAPPPGDDLSALHSRFLSDTSGLPEEWQDWRNDFARDIRALVEKGAGNG